MGVNNFWKIVKDAVDKPSLRTLTIREGFEGRQDRLFCIGVDISIWIRQLETTFATGHAQSGENPELRTFFYRLAMLAERPVHLVFVADGPQRPTSKRGKKVKTVPRWLEDGMRKIASAFGFPWITAAGEAEAELATMNALGIIDAVLTDDSDAFVFGAQVIIRNFDFKRDGPDYVDVYRAKAVREKMQLSQADMVFLAMLLGCDIDQTGLPQCGVRIALGLVRYGLGRGLCEELATEPSHADLAIYLQHWRARLRHLLSEDPNGFIGRRHPALAQTIPHNFPNLTVFRAFINPALLAPSKYNTLRDPRPMNLAQLGFLCERYFSFGNEIDILTKFRRILWTNEVVRMLINEALQRAGRAVETRSLLEIDVKKVNEPPATGYALAHVHITDSGFNHAVASFLRGDREFRPHGKVTEGSARAESTRKLTATIPALMIERARPLLVNPAYEKEGYLYGRPDREQQEAEQQTGKNVRGLMDEPGVSRRGEGSSDGTGQVVPVLSSSANNRPLHGEESLTRSPKRLKLCAAGDVIDLTAVADAESPNVFPSRSAFSVYDVIDLTCDD